MQWIEWNLWLFLVVALFLSSAGAFMVGLGVLNRDEHFSDACFGIGAVLQGLSLIPWFLFLISLVLNVIAHVNGGSA